LKTLIAIPAYNESEAILEVIKAIQANLFFDILVVDDGSVDNTGEIAFSAGAAVMSHPFNMGVGAAMRSAFKYANDLHYDIVVQVDADGQHNPSEIQNVIKLLDNCDIGIGSRLIEKTSYKFSKARRIAVRVLSWNLWVLTRKRILDPTSGFRASNKRAIQVFSYNYPSEYLGDTVASLLIADRFNLVIGETSVAMLERQGGKPSHNPLKSTLLMIRVILILIITKFRRLEKV
jgi:glycosyltransferase involved in cell wall biosynthesis